MSLGRGVSSNNMFKLRRCEEPTHGEEHKRCDEYNREYDNAYSHNFLVPNARHKREWLDKGTIRFMPLLCRRVYCATYPPSIE